MFCGTVLPRETPSAPPSAAQSRSVAELLAEVERHPDLGAWRAHVPSSGAALGRHVPQIVGGVVFAAFAFGMLVFLGSLGPLSLGAPPFVQIVLLVFIALGVGMALAAITRLGSFSSAPLQHVPALIADKRTHITGGGGDSSAKTTYFATLERADGTRSECEVLGERYGEIAPGDYGLAYVRSGVLLDSRRVGLR
jgi:hypothetical protein